MQRVINPPNAQDKQRREDERKLLTGFADKLDEAAEEIQLWGDYASSYFQEKHCLDETVEKFRTWAREYSEKARQ